MSEQRDLSADKEILANSMRHSNELSRCCEMSHMSNELPAAMVKRLTTLLRDCRLHNFDAKDTVEIILNDAHIPELLEALRWYALEDAYMNQVGSYGESLFVPAMVDKGAKARAALEKVGVSA